jgi:hypothetical protein
VTPNKHKGPKTLIPVGAKKEPKSEFHEDWREMRPAWRVSLLEMRTPFGWREIDEANATQVRGRLSSLESMKWREFIGDQNHFIKISALSETKTTSLKSAR